MITKVIKAVFVYAVLLLGISQSTLAGNLLWKVESENGTAYLLGSVHVGDSSMYPLNEAIEKAYTESCCLGFEFDISKVDMQSFITSAVKTDSTKLKDMLSPAVYDTVAAIITKMGLNETAMDMFQPWIIGLFVAQSGLIGSGMEASLGIDVYFLNKAKTDKKKTFDLESPDLQIDVFKRISKDTEKYFQYMLKDMNSTDYMIEDMIRAWIDGDDKKLENMLFPEYGNEFEEIDRVIIDERNVLMAEKIANRMQEPETLFIVVGAGHLIGKKSIIKILEDMGNFTITRID